MNTAIFNLGKNDFVKGAVTAILTGLAMAVLGTVQGADFNLFTADWGHIGQMASNGAFAGFVGYLVKNYFTDETGKISTPFGKIG